MIAGSAIDDFATAILLRHMRSASALAPGAPRFVLGRDLELLHCHWAISRPVRELATYLLENRHETQSLLAFRQRVDDAVARGRLDARGTMMHRLRTGLATAIVAAEPIRSYATGPNHVLAWVLRQAWQRAARFHAWQEAGTPYEINARSAVHLIDQVRRIEAVGAALSETQASRRPVAASLVAAERSRRKLYRLAHNAYRLFLDIERGDPDAIAGMLRDTLLVPLEDWRRLELAVALGVGEALAQETGQRLQLELLGMQARQPVLRCGPFAIFWQSLTAHYSAPPREPSEQRVADILKAYGLNVSAERPDLVVVEEAAGRAVGIIEVKFHGGDNPASRFREAVDQLVSYGRGYEADPGGILGRSAVAMNTAVPVLQEPAPGVPAAFSFDDIVQGRLAPWIKATWLP